MYMDYKKTSRLISKVLTGNLKKTYMLALKSLFIA